MAYYGDAGTLGPTTADWPVTPQDLEAVWATEGVPLGTRAEHAYETSDLARATIDALLDLAVGPSGLIPRSVIRLQDDGELSDDEARLRREITAVLAEAQQGTRLDAGGRLTRPGLTRAALHLALTWGDCWAVRVWKPRPGVPFGTRVRLIHPGRVSNPGFGTDTDTLYQGLELDPATREVVAIHVLRDPLGSWRQRQIWDRIPVVDGEGRVAVTHLQVLQLADRLRAPSVLAPALTSFRHVSKTLEAHMMAKLLQACHARIIRCKDPVRAANADRNGVAAEYDQKAGNVRWSTKPRPGMTIYVGMDTEVKDFAYQLQGQDLEAYVAANMASATAGTVRLPMPWVLRRLDKGNMASSRVALHQAYATAEEVQTTLIELQERQWTAWLVEEALLDGRIRLEPELWPLAYQVAWRRPAQPHPDENRAAQAAQSRRTLGQSPSGALGDLGLDFVQEVEQSAEDFAYARSRGVPLVQPGILAGGDPNADPTPDTDVADDPLQSRGAGGGGDEDPAAAGGEGEP